MDRYLYDEDDGITHPHLRVESAADALAVMFLVDCGVLPPLATDGPLPLDRARHLGHGNVLVFLDETPSSLLLNIPDGRQWQPPIKRQGVYIYRDCDESSHLHKAVLTARKNTIGDPGFFWHIVAYVDRDPSSRHLFKTTTVSRFARCVVHMPDGYFVPEFGKLAKNPPPPMGNANWGEIVSALPGAPIRYKQWRPGNLPVQMNYTNMKAQVLSTEVFGSKPRDLLANQRIGLGSRQAAALANLKDPPPTSASAALVTDEPSDLAPPQVISFWKFRDTFMRPPSHADLIAQTVGSTLESAEYRRCTSAFEADMSKNPDPRTTHATSQKYFADIFDICMGEFLKTCDRSINDLGGLVKQRVGPSTAQGALPDYVLRPQPLSGMPVSENWRECVMFLNCDTRDHQEYDASVEPGTKRRRDSGAADPSVPPPKKRRMSGPHAAREGEAIIGSSEQTHSETSPPCPETQFETMQRHASDVLASSPLRNYVLGASLSGVSVTFYCFDRAGYIQASAIDLEEEPEALVNAIVGISTELHRLEDIKLPSAGDNIIGIGLPDTLELEQRVIPLAQVEDSVAGASVYTWFARSTQSSASSTLEVVWRTPTGPLPIEESILRRAAEKGIKNVAHYEYSSTLYRLSSTPRTVVAPLSPELDKELQVTIYSPASRPLCEVTDPVHFRQAFVSLLKAHHALYIKLGYAHCNVNPQTLRVNCDAPSEGVLAGLASGLGQAGSVSEAFLSVDPMALESPTYHDSYRHDLEAFLFVLGWTAARTKKGPEEGLSLDGFIPTFLRTRDAKLHWLDVMAETEIEGGEADSVVPGIWLTELSRLFKAGYDARQQHKELHGNLESFDERSLGGHVTYEKFLEVLGKS